MNVSVAIITDNDQRILITQRPLHAPHGGLWEFPGGKLEQNESAEMALIREVKEEVGIDVLQYQSLGVLEHQYPDKRVRLHLFHVTQFQGVAERKEGQLAMKWVRLQEIVPEDFPEANHKIINMLPAQNHKNAKARQ